MKENRTVKISIDPACYADFRRLAIAKGMKIQAYLGLLIEREVEASSKSVEGPRR